MKRNAKRAARAVRRFRRAFIESLESRKLLASLVVNTDQDTTNPSDGLVSLREAVALAASQPGPDVISFSLPTDHRDLQIQQAIPIVIDSQVSLVGPTDGTHLRLKLSDIATPALRLLTVTSTADVSISDLILDGGKPNTTHLQGNGGSVWNAGNLHMTRVTVANGLSQSDGGGIFNAATGVIDIHDSTVSGNTARTGGAIRNLGNIHLSNVTIASNSAQQTGGIDNSGTLVLANTIVADSTGYDLSGNIVSLGYNLIENPGVVSGIAAGDRLHADPKLSPLQDNGGSSWTHLLLAGSPAIDNGSNLLTVSSTDQRGVERILDGYEVDRPLDQTATVDIGSYEFGTYIVNVQSDAADTTLIGDGAVDAYTTMSGPQVSLRGAIQELTRLAGWIDYDKINKNLFQGVVRFAPDVKELELTVTGASENAATTGDLDLYGSITIIGNDRPGDLSGRIVTTIDGGWAAYGPMFTSWKRFSDRIFHVLPAADVHFTKLSILGGHSIDDGSQWGGNGAGILNEGGVVHYEHGFIGNYQSYVGDGSNFAERKGGGIYSTAGAVYLDDARLNFNRAMTGGGGLWVESGMVSINNSKVEINNSFNYGGGIGISPSGNVVVAGASLITDNFLGRYQSWTSAGTNYRGGGVYNEGQLHISDNSVVSRNYGFATFPDPYLSQGLGIFNKGSMVIDSGSIVSDQKAYSAEGVGIYNAGTARINSVTLKGNRHIDYQGGGGAIYNSSSGILSISHSKLIDNEVKNFTGSALLNENGRVQLDDVEITGNGNGMNSYGTAAVANLGIDAVLKVHASLVRDNGSYFSGGILNISGQLDVSNTTFADNFGNGDIGSAISNIGINPKLSSEVVTLVTLAAAVDSKQTTLLVNNVTPLTRYALPLDVIVGEERMRVTALNTLKNSLTVTRSYPVAHEVSEQVNPYVNGSQTRIVVGDGSVFAKYRLPLDILIDNEIMRVTKVEGNVLTVERGRNNTPATEHLYPFDVWGVAGALTVADSTFVGNENTAIYNYIHPYVRPSIVESSTFSGNRTLAVGAPLTHSSDSTYVAAADIDTTIDVLAPSFERVANNLSHTYSDLLKNTGSAYWKLDSAKSVSMRIANSVFSDSQAITKVSRDETRYGVASFAVRGTIESGGGNFVESDRVNQFGLSVNLSSTQTEIPAPQDTSFPAFPFVAQINRLTDDQWYREKILVTGVNSAGVFQVVRGIDGTTAIPFPQGSQITFSGTGFNSPGDWTGSSQGAIRAKQTYVISPAEISETETTITVTNPIDFPPLPFSALLESDATNSGSRQTKEVVQVTERHGGTLTIVRDMMHPKMHSANIALTYFVEVSDRLDARLDWSTPSATLVPTPQADSPLVDRGSPEQLVGKSVELQSDLGATYHAATNIIGAVNLANFQTGLSQFAFPGDAEITVDSIADLPSTPFYVRINNEVMQVTSVDAASQKLTVQRGALGTTVSEHAKAEPILIAHAASSTDRSLLVLNVADFPEGPFYLLSGSEFLEAISVDRAHNIITVNRGMFGTIPGALISGAPVSDGYPNLGGFLLAFDPKGSGTVSQPRVHATRPLLADLSESEETIKFKALPMFQAEGILGSTLRIEGENLYIRAVSYVNNTISVVRGYNNTQPKKHLAGADAIFNGRVYAFSGTVTTLGGEAYMRIGPDIHRVEFNRDVYPELQGSTMVWLSDIANSADMVSPYPQMMPGAYGIPISTSTTVIDVADTSQLPPVPFLIRAQSERMLVTSVDKVRNTATVIRGALGTTPTLQGVGIKVDSGTFAKVDTNSDIDVVPRTARIGQELVILNSFDPNNHLVTLERGSVRTNPQGHRVGETILYGADTISPGFNGVLAFLTEPVGITQNDIVVTSAFTLPPTFEVQIRDEQLIVESWTALPGGKVSLHVHRGSAGTLPASHLAGAGVLILSSNIERRRLIDNAGVSGSSSSTLDIGASEAMVFEVNSFEDQPDTNPGDGKALSAAGLMTLRSAVMEANALKKRATLILNTGVYNLSTPLSITGDIRVIGAGGNRTSIVSSNGPAVSVAATGHLELSSAALTGSNPGSQGGAVVVKGGFVELTSVVLKNSNALAGGAVYVSGGTARVINSSIVSNTSSTDGGAIAVASGRVDIRNSTISGNTASNRGGAIYNGGQLTIVHATIAYNNSQIGGGLYNAGSTELSDTVVASNVGGSENADIYGAFVSGGANLVGIVPQPSAILVANMEDTGSFVSISNVGGIPQLPFLATIDDEVVRVDAVNGTTLTVTRGMGSAITRHYAGVQVHWDGLWAANDLTGTASSPLSAQLGSLVSNDPDFIPYIPLLESSPALDAGNTNRLGLPDVDGGEVTHFVDGGFDNNYYIRVDNWQTLPQTNFQVQVEEDIFTVTRRVRDRLFLTSPVPADLYYRGTEVHILTDQRGVPRPFDANYFSPNKPDIGAFEFASVMRVDLTQTPSSEAIGALTPFVFTISRSGDTRAAETVQWQLNDSGEHAADESDFASGMFGSVDFAPGQTSAAISVYLKDDFVTEFDEGFAFTISTNTDATFVLRDTAQAMIVDDDSVTLDLGSPQIVEGGGLLFHAVLTGTLQPSLFLPWKTLAGTAKENLDYNAAFGTISLRAPHSEIAVQTIADDFVEANENLSIAFDKSWLGTLSDRIHVQNNYGQITNDDVTQIRVIPTSIMEGNSGYALRSFTVEVGPKPVSTNFSLTAQTGAGSTPSATAGSDYQSTSTVLRFSGAAYEKQTFNVSVNGDVTNESDEKFNINLSNLSVASLFGGAITMSNGTVTILNDDAPRIVVQDAVIEEGNAGTKTLLFTVTRYGLAGTPVNVQASVTAGTATAGSDYTFTPQLLSFSGTAGESKTYSVTIVGDSVLEADETFTVTLGSVSNTSFALKNASGTIKNDDTAKFEISDVWVNEPGGKATFSIRLAGQVDVPVTAQIKAVGLSADASRFIPPTDPNNATATSYPLSFAAGVADQVLSVPVTIVNDSIAIGDATFALFVDSYSASGRIIGNNTRGIGTIIEDDFSWVAPPQAPDACSSQTGTGSGTGTGTGSGTGGGGTGTGGGIGTGTDSGSGSSGYVGSSDGSETGSGTGDLSGSGSGGYVGGLGGSGFGSGTGSGTGGDSSGGDSSGTGGSTSGGNDELNGLPIPGWVLKAMESGSSWADLHGTYYGYEKSYGYWTGADAGFTAISYSPSQTGAQTGSFTSSNYPNTGGSSGGGSSTTGDGSNNSCGNSDDTQSVQPPKPMPVGKPASWVIPPNMPLTFNPFAGFNYRLADQIGLTIGIGEEGFAQIGQTVNLKYGSVTVNPDFTITYTPLPNLESRTDDTRLYPEVDEAGNIVQFTGYDTFTAHIMNLGDLSGSSGEDSSLAIKLASQVVKLAVSNRLPALLGQFIHNEKDYDKSSLDGPVYADLNETYRIDVRDIYKDPDGDQTSLKIDGFATTYFEDGAFKRAISSELTFPLGTKTIGNYTHEYRMTVRSVSDYIIEIVNPLTPSDVQSSSWKSDAAGSLAMLTVVMNSGQKEEFDDPETPGPDFRNHTWDLHVQVRPNNSNDTSGTWRNRSGVPAEEFRSYLKITPSDQTDSAVQVSRQLILEANASSELPADWQNVGGIDVNSFSGSFKLAYPMQLDRSGGTSELALPGLAYDSSSVFEPEESVPTIVASLDKTGLAGTISTITATLKWYNAINDLPIATNTEQIPTQNAGNKYLFALRPTFAKDVNLPTGIYGWKLEVKVTTTDAGQSTTMSLSTAGESTIVNRNKSIFGSGWWLAGVPTFDLDKRGTDSKPEDDRLLINFPGERTLIFNGADLTRNYSATVKPLLAGTSTYGSEGMADPSSFGSVKYDPDNQEIVYTTGDWVQYHAKKRTLPDGNAVYLIDRIEQPNVDFDDQTTSGRRGVLFTWQTQGDHPFLEKITASDGAAITLVPDAAKNVKTVEIRDASNVLHSYSLTVNNSLLTKIEESNTSNLTKPTTKYVYSSGMVSGITLLEDQTVINGYSLYFYNTTFVNLSRSVLTGYYLSPKMLTAVSVGTAGNQINYYHVPAVLKALDLGTADEQQLESETHFSSTDVFGLNGSSGNSDRKTVHRYDLTGNLVESESFYNTESQTLTKYSYDNVGSVKTLKVRQPGASGDSGFQTTFYTYDYESPVSYTENDGSGDDQTPKYDPDDYRGNVTHRISPAGHFLFEYETDDEKKTGVGALVKSIAFAQVNAEGKVIKGGPDQNAVTYYTLDDFRRTVKTESLRGSRDSDSSSTQPAPNETDSVEAADYSDIGITRSISASGLQTDYHYDSMNRIDRKTVTDAIRVEVIVTSYTFDKLGFIDVETTAQQFGTGASATTKTLSVIDYDYDELGNLLKRTAKTNDESGTLVTAGIDQWVYDSLGHAVSHISGTGSTTTETTYKYDPLGRLIEETIGKGSAFVNRFLPNTPGGNTPSSTPAAASTEQTTKYAYYSTGQIKSVTHPDCSSVKYYYSPTAKDYGVASATSVTWIEMDQVAGESQLGTSSNNACSSSNSSSTSNVSVQTNKKFVTTTYNDSFGRVLMERDELTGREVKYQYSDVRNNSPTGISTVYVSEVSVTDGKPTAVKKKSETTLRYDAMGRVEFQSATDAVNQTFKYDVLGNQVAQAVMAPYGSVVDSEYDGSGSLTKTTTARKNMFNPTVQDVLRYEYDQSGALVKSTDGLTDGVGTAAAGTEESGAAPAKLQLTIDSGLRMVTGTGRDGSKTVQWFDWLGRKLKEKNDFGGATHYRYDILGNLVEKRVEADAPTPTAPGQAESLTTYVYDQVGRLRSTTINGLSTYYDFPKAADSSTIWTSAVIDPQGNVSAVLSDTLGKPIVAVGPAGLGGNTPDTASEVTIFSYGYDPLSMVQTVRTTSTVGTAVSPNSLPTVLSTYDKTLVTTQYISPDNVVLAAFHQNGLSATPVQTLASIVDSAGRVLAQVSGAGVQTTNRYDLTETGTGQIIFSQSTGSDPIFRNYDSVGNLIAVSDNQSFEEGETVRWFYDELGRQTIERIVIEGLSLDRIWHYAGNSTEYLNRNGWVITTVTDYVNRSIRTTGALNGVTQEVTNTGYYSDGSLATASNQGANNAAISDYSFGYDALDRLTKQRQTLGSLPNKAFDFAYSYTDSSAGGTDLARTLKQNGSDLLTTTMTFDRQSRLDKIVDLPTAASNLHAKSVKYEYDGSQITAIKRFNNATQNGDPVSNTTLKYGSDRQLESKQENAYGLLGDLHYQSVTYTKDGRLATVATSERGGKGTPLVYARDASGAVSLVQQLPEQSNQPLKAIETYAYNANGERAGSNEPFGQIVSDDNNRYAYDNEGNLSTHWRFSSRAAANLDASNDFVQGQYQTPNFWTPSVSAVSQKLTATKGWYRLELDPIRIETVNNLPLTVKLELLNSAGAAVATKIVPVAVLEETGEGKYAYARTHDFDIYVADTLTDCQIRVTVTANFATNSKSLPFHAYAQASLDRYETLSEYRYDSQNRQIEAKTWSLNTIDSSGVKKGEFLHTESMQYDALGNRVHVVITNSSNGIENDRSYVFENGTPLLEFNQDDQLERERFTASPLKQLLAVEDLDFDGTTIANAETIWTIPDYQGSIAVLYVSPQRLEVVKYDTFGQRLAGDYGSVESALRDAVTVGYLGMEFDSATLLHELHGQYYNASGGRLLSPQSYVNGANGIYAFGNNTPVDRLTGQAYYEHRLNVNDSSPTFWGTFNELYKPLNRVIGTVQVIGGVVEVAGGVAACSVTVIACVGGVFAVAHGLDDMQAGFRTLYGGEVQDTLLHSGVRAAASSAGVSDVNAERIATGVDILAGLLTGSVADGLKTAGKTTARTAALHAGKFAAVETGGIAIGAGVGFAATGTVDGALAGASFGQIGGSLAASAFVKCFVAGTLVWIPVDPNDPSGNVLAGIAVGTDSQQDSKWSLQAYVGLGLTLTASMTHLVLPATDEKKRRVTSGRPEDHVFDEGDWLRGNRLDLEDLVIELVEALGRDKPRHAWQ